MQQELKRSLIIINISIAVLTIWVWFILMMLIFKKVSTNWEVIVPEITNFGLIINFFYLRRKTKKNIADLQ